MAKISALLMALFAIFTFLAIAQATGAGLASSPTQPLSGYPTIAGDSVQRSSSSPLTLGEVVLTFVTGLSTIILNTLRGYVLLPPV
ncbi:hypothetical protein GGI26_001959 [Coemansia sp. RSA 1358]|uniref:Uncharacterized protein n=1 Tax=Coemansia umbellata TaxID=1424467 RepID=A0ABQ8PP20_9FUNG|nr:hypothetical protein BX070DRAFT_230221 [Coemansia spiralis]KAJ1991584.1 hypothetical protein EDC05_003349 [Coemansia umbellata]KAJ2623944.1 hypothetical protein GGI26_001959 [Coemansia sp. RSA 1358]